MLPSFPFCLKLLNINSIEKLGFNQTFWVERTSKFKNFNTTQHFRRVVLRAQLREQMTPRPVIFSSRPLPSSSRDAFISLTVHFVRLLRHYGKDGKLFVETFGVEKKCIFKYVFCHLLIFLVHYLIAKVHTYVTCLCLSQKNCSRMIPAR